MLMWVFNYEETKKTALKFWTSENQMQIFAKNRWHS